MSLDAFFEPSESDIKSKIRQRRQQMLVHSRVYYVMDDNLVDDHKWQQWADELRDLQEKYPQYTNIGFYDKEFSDWNGDTGAFLPLDDEWVIKKTDYIYKLVKKDESKNV
jgi:NAD-dependent DNA ligase adenylation domain